MGGSYEEGVISMPCDGEYALLDKAGKTLDRGKYIVIWKQEGGDWKLLRDMFSSNQPPPKS